MKVHEFEKIVNKLGLRTRNSGDRLAWFVYNGQTVVRTKRSQGNKEQPGDKIRQQLKVNEEQLAGLISCDVSLDDYVKILKGRKIIAPESQSASPLQPGSDKTGKP
ncbi:MAG TPA: hypothetical protein VGR72_10260 [Candidatus Acidoferrales bacterium]|nr:hypothetical protein [Candidatus Acidoferrales bacterium]